MTAVRPQRDTPVSHASRRPDPNRSGPAAANPRDARPPAEIADQLAAHEAGFSTLGGNWVPPHAPAADDAGQEGRFRLVEYAGWRFGIAAVALHDSGALERETQSLYSNLFAATKDRHLARIWNYVPAINAEGPSGLENYRAFCRGRSVAFESAFGAACKQRMPAASAVGAGRNVLLLVFAAANEPAVHIENPAQTPAYEYPLEYGPRAPSFARATVVRERDGSTTTFVSGTSAILGHATVAPFDTAAQVDCTVRNLDAVAQACGLKAGLTGGVFAARHFKVYLRHASECADVMRRLEHQLLRPGDQVAYVRADICRRELNVEIEATIRTAA